MNDQQAYEQLESTRPVITHVLRRDFHRYQTAEILAEKSMTSDDTTELRNMIRRASQYLFDNKHLVTDNGFDALTEAREELPAEIKAAVSGDIKTISCPYCGYAIGEWVFNSHVISCPKNPWTTITADPATLPADGGGHLLLSLRVEDWSGDKWIARENVTKAWYFDGHWQITTPGGSKIVPLYTLTSAHKKLTPYAWQPWPTPPPYPGGEGE